MPRVNSPSELEKLRAEILSKRDPDKPCIAICSGTGCHAYGSERVNAAFEEELKKQGLEGKIDIRRTGCHGFCERGTLVVIYPDEICYTNVQPEDAIEVVQSVKEKKVIDRLLYSDPVTGEKITREPDIPFYKHQQRIIFGPNRWIDPKNIEDYISLGGYSALSKALFQMTPDQVLQEVKRANLRGRGGAGFPAGMKWSFCRAAKGEPKYVVCNADEGDPGAYMDRSLLEGNPHSVLEGMLIGAYAIGASKGYVYVRTEYPLAIQNLEIAIEQAMEYGLLGENILNSGFSLTIKIAQGAGAFVCGEETALIASIEGRNPEPVIRPPFPAQSGLWGKPTNINNVETWANVPLIINRGAEWYSQIGTERSKGTKIFSLVGKINNTGLVEVPMGITLREIIYDIGGGIPGGKDFKAVQTGGPSGGCIPSSLIDIPVDYEHLEEIGSMMGSGGMVVMDEDTCIVDVARFFTDFTRDESCGRCNSCREGLDALFEILTRISKGEGKEGDLELLEDLGKAIKDFSLCGLGQTAPNPVLTTIKYFRDEYEAHIKEKRCPAKVCKNLISYYIEPDKCQACMICLRNCPVGAIDGGKGLVHVINQENCSKCGTCLDLCPPRFSAVVKLSGEVVPTPPLSREVAGRKGSYKRTS